MVTEKVHGIVGYYDGILDGVADFRGVPHAFVVDGDMDQEAPRYRLKPLSDSEFALFVECWQIWRRWEAAFERGEAVGDGEAVLPADQTRHDEIEAALTNALDVPKDSALVRRGLFRPSTTKNPEQDGLWGGFDVEWIE